MTQLDLITALCAAKLFRGVFPLDDMRYEPVSVSFIEIAAEKWVNMVLPSECTQLTDVGGGKTVRVPRWVEEAGDCDNISKSFAAYLSECEWLKACKWKTPLGNIAAGIVRFVPDGGTMGHAVNWFVDLDGVAHVFDAGTLSLRTLSATELESIYGGETI